MAACQARSISEWNPSGSPCYGLSRATLPHGWTTYTFWQDADRDYFNGDHDRLLAFARGAS